MDANDAHDEKGSDWLYRQYKHQQALIDELVEGLKEVRRGLKEVPYWEDQEKGLTEIDALIAKGEKKRGGGSNE